LGATKPYEIRSWGTYWIPIYFSDKHAKQWLQLSLIASFKLRKRL
jgi:hypothetical protein